MKTRFTALASVLALLSLAGCASQPQPDPKLTPPQPDYIGKACDEETVKVVASQQRYSACIGKKWQILSKAELAATVITTEKSGTSERTFNMRQKVPLDPERACWDVTRTFVGIVYEEIAKSDGKLFARPLMNIEAVPTACNDDSYPFNEGFIPLRAASVTTLN
jgi:hypothetical protein